MPSKKHKTKSPILQVFLLSVLSIFLLFILVAGFSIHQQAQPDYLDLPPIKVEEGIPYFELEHIEYFFKGLKFYKLHSNLFDLQPAKVKLVIFDSNQVFYATFTSNFFKVGEEATFDDPDLVIYLKGKTLVNIIQDVDNLGLVHKLIEQGDIRLNYNSNKFTLFMKGFHATHLKP